MSYTQAPPLTDIEIESLLNEALIARICTHNPDGTIHAAPIWFRYEKGVILIGTPKKSRKANNIRKNSKVTVLVDVDGPPTRGVIIYGVAELDDLDSRGMMTEGVTIFNRYMSEEKALVYAKGLDKISKWVKITITPNKISSFNYGKDEYYRKMTQG